MAAVKADSSNHGGGMIHQHQQQPPPIVSAAAAAAATSTSQALPLEERERVRVFYEILSRVPAEQVEAALDKCGVSPAPEAVEEVLRLCYAHPGGAVKFFRWAGQSLKHTSFAWNLMVDILGKSGLFEAMWDAVRSMKKEGALSTATFASAFGSYCAAGRIKEAIMTFDVMDRYGTPQDVVAVNSLLSAICRQDGHASDAAQFFDRIKATVPPDADTFAILLEGWEKEGNVARAKNTFGEMVIRVGWSPDNMSAYDAFLTTLVRAAQPEDALNFLRVMKSKGCLPGIKFFGIALDALVKQADAPRAAALWEIMVDGAGLIPNAIMYNAMIALLCDASDIDSAYRLLDAMPLHGVFPDSLTYNTIFECLVRSRRACEAGKFLAEMRKNEQPPSPPNAAAAIRMLFAEYDPYTALEVWNCVLEDHVSPIRDCANELLIGLAGLGRTTEMKRYAEEMLDMGIELQPSTMEKLKSSFDKAHMSGAYDLIDRRLKGR